MSVYIPVLLPLVAAALGATIGVLVALLTPSDAATLPGGWPEHLRDSALAGVAMFGSVGLIMSLLLAIGFLPPP